MHAGCGDAKRPKTIWDFKTGGIVHIKPVLFKDRVYVSSDKLYCLDKQSGRLLWDFDTLGDMRASAVISDDNRIYFNIGGLYCLDAFTGVKIWEFWRGNWSDGQPAVAEGQVYTIADKHLYCLDAHNGRLLWEAAVDQSCQPPLFFNGYLFMGCFERIACFSAETGQRLWTHILGDKNILDTIQSEFKTASFAQQDLGATLPGVLMSVSEGLLFCTSLQNKIFCINGMTGEIVWQCDVAHAALNKPVVLDDHVYVCGNELLCLDVKTGCIVWRSSEQVLAISADLQLAGNQLTIRYNRRLLGRFDAATGSCLKTYKIVSGSDVGAFIIKDENIFYSKKNTVLCGLI